MINGVVSSSPGFLPFDRYLKERLIHPPWLEPDEERRRYPSFGRPSKACPT
ncbi:MAG: hypothetical protein M3T56_14980 [Chloroflexota bacterium]|nr:hypothetical protein [Chloroflexota bacterium]